MAEKTTKKKKTAAKAKKKPSSSKKKPAAKKKKKTSEGKASSSKKGALLKDRKNILLLVIAALVIAGIIIGCIFASKANKTPEPSQKISQEITKKTAWGIDVSSHNGKINWKKVSKKADFAFIRAGYRGYANGEIKFDKKMKANLAGANKYGVPAGVYFYTQAINEKEAEKEAEFVLKKIKGYDITLPVVIDFEYAYKKGSPTGRLHNASLSKKEKTAIINAFCNKVRKAGYIPGVYASSYIYRWHFNMKSIPDDVFIWVADYNGKVTYDGYYDIWQYSEKGKCDGVSSKHVDTNYFYTNKRLKVKE